MGTVYFTLNNSKNGSAGSRRSYRANVTTAFNVNETANDATGYKTKNFGKQALPGLWDTVKPMSHKINVTDAISNFKSEDKLADKLNKTVGIPSSRSSWSTFNEYTGAAYNRFKIPVTSDKLMRGFGHVFFVKPNCNIMGEDGGLEGGLKNNPIFTYVNERSPRIIENLVLRYGRGYTDFSYALSNAVTNFPLSDEFIETDTYGNTWTGYKISYGRHNIDSKTAGEISLNFRDDRDLRIYQIHKLWIEYISGCYRGEIYPTNDTIIDKILDYAGAIYYILTAEDGETILFWSKYYGTFPITIPSEAFTWAEGNTVQNPELTITYRYSYKEDYNPVAISEFNMNTSLYQVVSNNIGYVPTYDSLLGTAGNTWVGAPYIEEVKEGDSILYKLRFIGEIYV